MEDHGEAAKVTRLASGLHLAVVQTQRSSKSLKKKERKKGIHFLFALSKETMMSYVVVNPKWSMHTVSENSRVTCYYKCEHSWHANLI